MLKCCYILLCVACLLYSESLIFAQQSNNHGTNAPPHLTQYHSTPTTSTTLTNQPSGHELYNRAYTLFQQKQFDAARNTLLLIQANPQFASLHPKALALLATIHVADGEFTTGKEYYNTIVSHYPHSDEFEAARYHIARLDYYLGRYTHTIQSLETFRTQFPQSDYVGNSYYWSGLAYKNLGDIHNARAMFERVVYGYPSSYRLDSARHELAALEQSNNDDDLLEVIRWAHEEYLALLRSVEQEASNTEVIFENFSALEVDTQNEELLSEYRNQIERLRTEVDSLKRVEVMERTSGVVDTTARSQRLLELRELFEETRIEILERINDATNDQIVQ